MRDFTITEAIEGYPILRRIIQHLEDHWYLTREDYGRILSEETQAQMRRDQAEFEGGKLTLDYTDLSGIT
jgi:ribosomal protein S19E (S16A)